MIKYTIVLVFIVVLFALTVCDSNDDERDTTKDQQVDADENTVMIEHELGRA